MNQLPVAVQQAINERAQGGTIRGLVMEKDNGKTVYEAELTIGGRNTDLTLDEQGKVIDAALRNGSSKVVRRAASITLPLLVKGEVRVAAADRQLRLVDRLALSFSITSPRMVRQRALVDGLLHRDRQLVHRDLLFRPARDADDGNAAETTSVPINLCFMTDLHDQDTNHLEIP